MCEMPQNNIQGTQPIQKPRVMYLDVDDSIIIWTNKILGYAAPMAAEFVKWADTHFEIRWLTMWATSGDMREELTRELSYRFNNKIPPDMFKRFVNPKSFESFKTDAIDYNDPRPWVWVEDGALPKERVELESRRLYHNFYSTNVSRNMVELQRTWKLLTIRFDLPGGPPEPYVRGMDLPKVLLTDKLIAEMYRGKN